MSRYRTHLMGVAALLIILCHAPAYGVAMQGLPRRFFVFGNIGVDIFLFLSGIGCWFSLMKSPRFFPWLKRRLFRVFIPYTITLLMLRLLSLWVDHIPWREWLLYFSTVRFWTHHVGMWYVALLVFLYPLAPLLSWMIDHSKSRFATTMILIIIILLLTHIPVKQTGEVMNSIIINLQWAFKRVVSFILGLYLAPYIKQGLNINALSVIGISALGGIVFHVFIRGVFFEWLYVVPMVIMLCMFFEKFPAESSFSRFFKKMGDVSLESYLWNVGLNALIPLYLNKWIILPLFAGHYFDYLLVIALGLSMSFLTHFISERIKNLSQ